MKTIWKFEIIVDDSQTVEMPKGAKILCVQTQLGSPCLWAEVESSSPMEKRTIDIFGTGHPLREDIGVDREYIGTFQMRAGALVFHAYENKEV